MNEGQMHTCRVKDMPACPATMTYELATVSPFTNFHEASRSVLEHLHQVLGFNLWMVTRTEGEDWIVLEADDHGYGVKQGDVFRWTDSFCSRMVEGLGPCIAPRADDIPAYLEAPIGQQVEIGAYVGVPLRWNDGELFGTMCAIHPTERPASIAQQLPLVEVFARLLSSVLKADLDAEEQRRCADRAQVEAMTDELTGLYNRRGWQRLIAMEEARCRRYGHPACMISIDLDGLKFVNDRLGHARGDELLRAAAEGILAELRAQDVAARLGGDEFAVLAVECDAQGIEDLQSRIQQALSERKVEASLGVAACKPSNSFSTTWDLADQSMYEEKRARTQMPKSLAALIA